MNAPQQHTPRRYATRRIVRTTYLKNGRIVAGYYSPLYHVHASTLGALEWVEAFLK
jgi:hypothetical protein